MSKAQEQELLGFRNPEEARRSLLNDLANFGEKYGMRFELKTPNKGGNDVLVFFDGGNEVGELELDLGTSDQKEKIDELKSKAGKIVSSVLEYRKLSKSLNDLIDGENVNISCEKNDDNHYSIWLNYKDKTVKLYKCDYPPNIDQINDIKEQIRVMSDKIKNTEKYLTDTNLELSELGLSLETEVEEKKISIRITDNSNNTVFFNTYSFPLDDDFNDLDLSLNEITTRYRHFKDFNKRVEGLLGKYDLKIDREIDDFNKKVSLRLEDREGNTIFFNTFDYPTKQEELQKIEDEINEKIGDLRRLRMLIEKLVNMKDEKGFSVEFEIESLRKKASLWLEDREGNRIFFNTFDYPPEQEKIEEIRDKILEVIKKLG